MPVINIHHRLRHVQFLGYHAWDMSREPKGERSITGWWFSHVNVLSPANPLGEGTLYLKRPRSLLDLSSTFRMIVLFVWIGIPSFISVPLIPLDVKVYRLFQWIVLSSKGLWIYSVVTTHLLLITNISLGDSDVAMAGWTANRGRGGGRGGGRGRYESLPQHHAGRFTKIKAKQAKSSKASDSSDVLQAVQRFKKNTIY